MSLGSDKTKQSLRWPMLAAKFTIAITHFTPCITCVQYRGGFHDACGNILSTVGDVLNWDLFTSMHEHEAGSFPPHFELRIFSKEMWSIEKRWSQEEICLFYISDVKTVFILLQVLMDASCSDWVEFLQVYWVMFILIIVLKEVLKVYVSMWLFMSQDLQSQNRGYSVPWGISWCTRGDIMSIVGVFSTIGEISFVIWVPPQYWTPPRYSRYPPHLSWYPPWYWTSTTVLKISPTVLNTPRYYTHVIQGVLADISWISRTLSQAKVDMSQAFKSCRARSWNTK